LEFDFRFLWPAAENENPEIQIQIQIQKGLERGRKRVKRAA
jgi:hypothetical protein